MAIKGNLCRQLFQFKNMDAVCVFTKTSVPSYINLCMFPEQLHERVAENTVVAIKAECLAYFEGGTDPVEGPSVRRKGKDSRKGPSWGIARERKVTLHVLFRSNVISKTAYPSRDY